MKLTKDQLEALKRYSKDEESLQALLATLTKPSYSAHLESFHAIAQFVPYGLILLHADMTICAVNQMGCDLLRAEQSSLVGVNLADIYPNFARFAQMVVDKKAIHNLEGIIQSNNGKPTPLFLSANRILIEETPYIVLHISDTADWTQSIQKLRESETRYRNILENQIELICHYKPNFEVTFANRAYCQYFGHDPVAVIGNNLLDLLTPGMNDWAINHVNEMVKTGRTVQFEREVMLHNGELRWMQWTDQPLLNDKGEVVEIQAVGRDVTTRHLAESALVQQQTQLRMMLDSLPGTMMLMFDESLKCTMAEGRGLEFVGLLPENMLNLPIVELFTADSDPTIEQACQDALEGNYSELQLHITNTLLRVQIYPLEIANEHTHIDTGMIILEDITERNAIELQKLQFNMELERRQLVTEFVQDASHEFRTPLAIIETALYLVLRASDEEKRQESAKKIRRQIERMNNLVDSLVTISRLNSVSEFHQSKIYLRQVIEAIVIRHNDRAMLRDVQITFDAPDEIPNILGSTEDLILVFHHLLDNAIKFSKPEGGNISISVRQRDSFVDVIIQDNGIGIPRGELLRIFERFYRTDMSHSTPGLGLGLAIVKAIVEGHGGYIHIDSEKGIGTTAIVSLPV